MEQSGIREFIGKSITAIERRDALSLRRVSSEAASEAAIEGHRELILLSLIDYSLGKIMSKLHYTDLEKKFYEGILTSLRKASAGPKEEMIKQLEYVEDAVIKLDREEGNYAENIMDKARVKKAAKLYEQGLSLRRASELTGAETSRVMSYVGGSKIHEFEGRGKNAERLRVAREVFS